MEPDDAIRRSDRVVFRELTGEAGGVLLHLDSGAYHGLNPVGSTIWRLIGDEGVTFADLVASLRRELPDAPDGLAGDIGLFLEGLMDRNLVVLEPSDSEAR